MGYPELCRGPKIMPKKEKVEISHSVWLSATGPEINRIDIVCVLVGIDGIFLENSELSWQVSQFMLVLPKCA